MALRHLAAALALLGVLSCAAGQKVCDTTASAMFGAPWKPTYSLYTHESSWRIYGNITKVNVYLNQETGCLVGVKATYGWDALNAKRIGIEKIEDESMYSKDLKLQPGEFINKAQFKFGSCITYLSLDTNFGRQLAIGDSGSSGMLQTSIPGSPYGYLAFVKGYTDEPNHNASVGKLKQLQLVWASKRCAPPEEQNVAYSQQAPNDDGSVLESAEATYAAETVEEVSPEQLGEPASYGEQPASYGEQQEQTAYAAPVHPFPAAAAAAINVAAAAHGTPSWVPVSEEAPEPSYPNPTAQPSYSAVVSEPVQEVPVSSNMVVSQPAAGPTYSQQPAAYASGEYNATTVSSYGSSSAGPATCNPGMGCYDGICPTSSCALNGMGKDVVTMMCFGTNLLPNPLLAATGGNPCSNLACKLDRSNCTADLLGYCTGKVVAMGAAARLHPSGKAFVGYPCIEHRGPMLDIVPVSDYSARGMYVGKAWKVCDCIKGLGLNEESLAIKIPGGSVSLSIPTLPNFPFVARPLMEMTVPEVLTQWLVANENESPLPRVYIGSSQSNQLQILLPNFTMPSIVIPRISAPLLNVPHDFGLPIFTIPGDNTLQRITLMLPNITSLPTIFMPRIPSPTSLRLPSIQIPQITVPNITDLAEIWGVPTMPKMPPLPNLDFQDVVTLWTSALRAMRPVPRVHLPDIKIDSILRAIPDFRVPSVLVPNISAPLMHVPDLGLPVFELPTGSNAVRILAEIIPKLSALPTIALPQFSPPDFRLPNINMFNVTVPDFTDVVSKLGATLPAFSRPHFNLSSVPQWPPRIPGMPGHVATGYESPESPPPINITLPTNLGAIDLSSLLQLPGGLGGLGGAGSGGFKLPGMPGHSGINAINISIPDLNIPGINLPGAINISFPDMPDLRDLVGAIGQMPEMDVSGLINWEQAANFFKQYATNYLGTSRFDLPAFLDMLRSTDVIANVMDGFQVSFEVPDVLAQWVAGIVQHVPLPSITVPESTMQQLRRILPDLPEAPSLVMVNISSPYFNAASETAQELPTYVIPDHLIPQVTQFLPNLTALPSLLVPGSSANIGFTMPSITLPDVTLPAFMDNMGKLMARLHAVTSGADVNAVATNPSAPPSYAGNPSSDGSGTTFAIGMHPSANSVGGAVADGGDGGSADGGDGGSADSGYAGSSPVTLSLDTVHGLPHTAQSQYQFASTAPRAVPSGAASEDGVVVTEADERDVLESAKVDDEGAVALDGMGGPGAETAYMDPKEFYALDRDTQQAMLAMLAV